MSQGAGELDGLWRERVRWCFQRSYSATHSVDEQPWLSLQPDHPLPLRMNSSYSRRSSRTQHPTRKSATALLLRTSTRTAQSLPCRSQSPSAALYAPWAVAPASRRRRGAWRLRWPHRPRVRLWRLRVRGEARKSRWQREIESGRGRSWLEQVQSPAASAWLGGQQALPANFALRVDEDAIRVKASLVSPSGCTLLVVRDQRTGNQESKACRAPNTMHNQNNTSLPQAQSILDLFPAALPPTNGNPLFTPLPPALAKLDLFGAAGPLLSFGSVSSCVTRRRG